MKDKEMIEEIAEELIKQDYCELPEGARVSTDAQEFVVLTREEYEGLKIAKDFDYGYHEGERNMTSYYENIRLPEVRKETAEKILNKVDYESNGQTKQITDLLRKQFGVEVEE